MTSGEAGFLVSVRISLVRVKLGDWLLIIAGAVVDAVKGVVGVKSGRVVGSSVVHVCCCFVKAKGGKPWAGEGRLYMSGETCRGLVGEAGVNGLR